jgi:hypothetical protein
VPSFGRITAYSITARTFETISRQGQKKRPRL